MGCFPSPEFSTPFCRSVRTLRSASLSGVPAAQIITSTNDFAYFPGKSYGPGRLSLADDSFVSLTLLVACLDCVETPGARKWSQT